MILITKNTSYKIKNRQPIGKIIVSLGDKKIKEEKIYIKINSKKRNKW